METGLGTSIPSTVESQHKLVILRHIQQFENVCIPGNLVITAKTVATPLVMHVSSVIRANTKDICDSVLKNVATKHSKIS